jgi:hypothetical protein
VFAFDGFCDCVPKCEDLVSGRYLNCLHILKSILTW